MKWLVTAMLVLVLFLPGCSRHEQQAGKLQVVTTLFPLYDFAKRIGGDQAQVSLLLPPGVEPHSFEPRPEDIVRVNHTDLFVYTNDFMEPWVGKLVSGLDKGKVQVIEGGKGIALQAGPAGDEDEHEHRQPGAKAPAEAPAPAQAPGHAHEHEAGGMDPHIWLDFQNARTVAGNILAAMEARDPAHQAYYRQNAAGLDRDLAALDVQYRETLARCPKKVFLHGGHYAFGYLARRYGLRYISASAVNADAEPTPTRLAELVKLMRREGLVYVYTEELLSPKVAETIARETGARVLMLRAAHNLTKEEFEHGVSFISLMQENLVNLQKGLQ